MAGAEPTELTAQLVAGVNRLNGSTKWGVVVHGVMLLAIIALTAICISMQVRQVTPLEERVKAIEDKRAEDFRSRLILARVDLVELKARMGTDKTVGPLIVEVERLIAQMEKDQ
jgi:hypothetical protein